jgi:hypothetical protein
MAGISHLKAGGIFEVHHKLLAWPGKIQTLFRVLSFPRLRF